MDYDELVAAVRRSVDDIDRALHDGPVDIRVPSCPDWTLADLTRHLGEFAGWWTKILCDGTGRPAPEFEVPEPAQRVNWWRTVGSRLVAELEETPPSTTVWTWSPDDKTASFVARRCAHELAMHGYDAQLARGVPASIPADVATDGIDELLFTIIANLGSAPDGHGETLHLHATDCDAEWMVRFEPDRLDVRHEHGKGDQSIRGAVSDLELMLYQRPTIGPVEYFGSSEPMERLHGTFVF